MGANLAKNSGNKRSANPYAHRSINTGSLEKQCEVRSPRTPTAGDRRPALLPTEHNGEESLPVSPEVAGGYASSDDEFYDGIPRYRRTVSQKSRSRRHKVSEVGSLLGRAGSVGLEKAAGVLDSLGSTVTSGGTSKSNELSILSFEVANTIVKGSNIMQSLSQGSIRLLKEVVFPSQGVQQLVSTDLNEVLNIVAADKREELKIFLGEVVRFGNRCKDSQWHNLDLFFEKHSRCRTSQKQLQNQAEIMMQQLMVLVQQTAELYQELHTLDKLEQDYQCTLIFGSKPFVTQRVGNSLAALSAEIKSQRKLVRNLKKKSLWSRSLEEVMEKLIDIVLFLNQEITTVFGNTANDNTVEEKLSDHQRLGPVGLALHYANIILLIDSIVARSSSFPPNARDTLYQSLPPHMKTALRSKLQSFHVEEELSITEIKAEMEKTLRWIVPIANNTARAYHGFGWVGEWGNTGSESNRQTSSPSDFVQIETLHHANRSKTETYILELLLWLNYLVTRSNANISDGKIGKGTPSTEFSFHSPVKEKELRCKVTTQLTALTSNDQKTVSEGSNTNLTPDSSESWNLNAMVNSSDELEPFHNSSSRVSMGERTGVTPAMQPSSNLPHLYYGLEMDKKLDLIDRVETLAPNDDRVETLI